VPNDADQCPTTPPGRVVDATGCQLDTDGDSVIDAEDQCPDTPAGAAVDARGCPLDSDGDGVPDFRDDCPDSEAGAKVDERGCYRVLEEQVTIDMNIEFATNEATISPDHVPELSRVVKILREYPNADAVIEGHTDSDGAASYNQSLSERRAKAVYDYLISDAKVNASRLRWAGFGESRPVASNDTSAGKQRNRRVTAIVTGSQTVRQ
jgi:OOP family OmpA-OmpF porin